MFAVFCGTYTCRSEIWDNGTHYRGPCQNGGHGNQPYGFCSRWNIKKLCVIVPITQIYTAISIKVVHEQSEKVEYERERLLGIALKFINLLGIPTSLSRSYSTFPLCSWTTLIEIAVCC